MVQFSKRDNVYRIVRITGRQDNILGVCFSESDKKDDENNIDVIEWDVKEGEKIQTSKDQVLKQVLSGLKRVNESLGTNYQLSKIYFLPSDRAADFVYRGLIARLIRHSHSGNEFKEVGGVN